MPISNPYIIRFLKQFKNVVLLSIVLASCIVPKKYQKDKPFIIENNFKVKGGKFTKDEITAIKTRLNGQLDDSSKINVVDHYFIRHVFNSPAAYDSNSAAQSVINMQAIMPHLGYYRATAGFTADTLRNYTPQRVKVQYTVEPGKPTLIDTTIYFLRKADLQEIANKNLNNSLLKQDAPVTKAAVLGEISRLVDIYRNNGYYKFSSEEIKVRGDTTLEALTNISDDPFEQLRLLAEAQQKKDSPKIKLAVVLNVPTDSTKLKRYYINNVYILPDFIPGDKITDSLIDGGTTKDGYIIRYHNKIFKTSFLKRNMFLKKGDLYRQTDFYRTLNSFSRIGVWQSTNIEIVEVKDNDSVHKINLIVQLIPAKQFAFEAAIEASYSANSNTNSVATANAGNLLGLSGNVALTNRNLGKEGIKMTNAARAGVELNLSSNKTGKRDIINSNDVNLSNNLVFPRAIFPFRWLDSSKRFSSPESFINTNFSYINRINLFNLQSFNLGIGYTARNRKNGQLIFKLLNAEFTKLYNQSDSFTKTLNENPFLRYSFNTALVAGSSFSYSNTKTNIKHSSRQHSIKINVDESGFPMGIPLRAFNTFKNYKNLRQYLKADVLYTHSRSKPKSALIFRVFGGLGIASKRDTTLPFFKQYFGGGSNSMRGWPVRGIGLGAKPLSPYSSNRFNDRTGDIQFETNIEYRYNIAQIIPNTLVLKGALFADFGNIWNLRNSTATGTEDTAQFKFKNLWKEMGVDAGLGFRLDFNYFVVRFDFGLRFKRPELSYINNGWKIPALGFDDVFKKVFAKGTDDEYRRWRYENFNFTIGINYPF